MSLFRTPLGISRSQFTITLRDSILTIGSCFSDMLGDKLSANKFCVSRNPFGTVYNPHSIHKLLRYSISNEMPVQNTFIHHDEVFSNYDFHSSFSGLQQLPVEQKIKDTINSCHTFLKNSNFLIITYGTAWVYERKDVHEIVANCHKVESGNFSKYLLSTENIIESFDKTLQSLLSFNPDLKIILTVSPVRHIKETLELNSVSKSTLRLACHALAEKYQNVEYFPSFEILMDDLRDYRFYSSDMIHPSEEAEKYIWEKFIEKYFDNTLIQFLEKWKNVKAALAHTPFHPNSSAHQSFLKNTLLTLQELQSTVNVDSEIKFISDQINRQ